MLLTEREKQVLRLIVRGHDARSVAQELGLSIHTVNERLREARRKLNVASSRAAARLLLMDDEQSGTRRFNEQSDSLPMVATIGIYTPETGSFDRKTQRSSPIRRFVSALTSSHDHSSSPDRRVVIEDGSRPGPAVGLVAARLLAALDHARWDAVDELTDPMFEQISRMKPPSRQMRILRPPLGNATSRLFLSQEHLEAPPHGYEVLKFLTDFSNGGYKIETVTLFSKDLTWKVVSYSVS